MPTSFLDLPAELRLQVYSYLGLKGSALPDFDSITKLRSLCSPVKLEVDHEFAEAMFRYLEGLLSAERSGKTYLFRPASFIEARELRLSIPISYIMDFWSRYSVSSMYQRLPQFMHKMVFLVQRENLNVLHRDAMPAWGYMIHFCRTIGLNVDRHGAANGRYIRVEVHCADQDGRMDLVVHGRTLRDVAGLHWDAKMGMKGSHVTVEFESANAQVIFGSATLPNQAPESRFAP
jgi:hypothetical protein